MLIYDETIRVLNEEWAYIAKEYDDEECFTFIFDDLENFLSQYEEYQRGVPNSLADEFFIRKHPSYQRDGIKYKSSLVMQFQRKENDDL
ncbi:MAG: hypothetical protein LW696_07735 [Alphaproteobacteria bacterium]|jgi:5'-deoxynucleotidase YfbR-like HD superfamily hydrolase|nr:hypothetical protein [Alphaproteobacteria bacterium]